MKRSTKGVMAMPLKMTLFATCLISGIAYSQTPFEIEGALRTRIEARTNADFNSSKLDGATQVFNRVRLALWRSFDDEGLMVYLQAQDSRIWGESGSTLTPLEALDVHQAYFVVRRPASLPFDLYVGRQKLSFGSQRLVGEYDWHNVSRSFDAARFLFAWDDISVNIFAAHLRDLNSPVVFRNQDFGGVFMSTNQLLLTLIDSYFLVLVDDRNFESIANPQPSGVDEEDAATLKSFTAGTRFRQEIGEAFICEVEGAYQFGDRGFSGINAFGFAALGSYTLPFAWSPTVNVGYSYGSGDSDPSDKKSETFSNLFPDAHRYFGALDYASWSNISDIHAGIRFEPADIISFGAEWHLLSLANENDSWYRGEGFTIGTPDEIYRQAAPGSGKTLGNEIDLFLGLSASKRISLDVGGSVFLVGDFVENTAGGKADNSIWGYLSATVIF